MNRDGNFPDVRKIEQLLNLILLQHLPKKGLRKTAYNLAAQHQVRLTPAPTHNFCADLLKSKFYLIPWNLPLSNCA